MEPGIDPFLQFTNRPGAVYKLEGEQFVTAPGGFGGGIGYPQFRYDQSTPELTFDDYIPREIKGGDVFLGCTERGSDPVRLSGDKWKTHGMPIDEAIIEAQARGAKYGSKAPDFALIPEKAFDNLLASGRGKVRENGQVELAGPGGPIWALAWPSLTTDGFALWSGGWGWLQKRDGNRILLALKLQGSVRMIDMI